MEINSIYKELSEYLLALVETPEWKEAVLNIEVQPGMLGLNGYFIDKRFKKNYLRTRPTETIKGKIKLLHSMTAKDDRTKWNKFRMTVKDFSIHEEFFWDQEWQNEVDKLNLEAKQKDHNYIIPKWHWEID
jgi:hypothetical protein